MQRDRALQIRMLREVRSKVAEDYGDIPSEFLAYNAALLIEEGLVRGRPVKGSQGQYVAASLIDLTTRGHDFLDQLDTPASQPSENTRQRLSMTIFISHASADKVLAGALARLLRSAFNLPTDEIRCTSVDEFRLQAGADTNDQLRQEVRESKVFIGIITPASIQSAYVLFELGARWGAKLPLYPVLARGAGSSHLKGPLSTINALDISNPQLVRRLLEDVARGGSLVSERQSALETSISLVATEAASIEPESITVSSGGIKSALAKESLEVLKWLFQHGDPASTGEVQKVFELSKSVAQFHLDQLDKENLVSVHVPQGYGPHVASTYSINADGRAFIMAGSC